MSGIKAFCEINEQGDRMEVHFRYSKEAVLAIKGDGTESNPGVPGRRFVPPESGGPHWTVPLDLVTASRLREAFGRGLILGDAVKKWGKREVRKQRNLRAIARANDAELERVLSDHIIARAINGEALSSIDLDLAPTHPLCRKRDARPYQRADIAMMARTNVLNANQPGTGKTIETLGSWVESELIDGPHLIVAPVRSLENVWLEEAWRWVSAAPVFTAEDPHSRRHEIEEGLKFAEKGEPVILCVNFDMIRLTKYFAAGKKGTPGKELDVRHFGHARADHKGNRYGFRSELQKRLFKVNFKTATVDEFHKSGLPNRVSLFALGMSLVKAAKRAALSGTPMGGKPRKLWAVLNWLEPHEYKSEWRWIDQWLEVDDNGYGKVVTNIKPGREDEFYEAHARHLVRRLKREALPGLPPQVQVIVKTPMTPAQKKQYEQFERDAEIMIDEERLSGNNILAEYARLKQFANAKQEMRAGVPYPIEDSGKLAYLLQKLDEEGIRKDDPEPGARAIIGSESKRMVDMVVPWLRKQGIECDSLTGATKDAKPIIKKFSRIDKWPAPYVIVMTVQTGGVSLNLEEAGSMHALDETWNPDDMEQFFDRGDRGSRTEPLRCYIYRSPGTIQDYIAQVNEGKSVTNKNILDLRRRMHEEES